MRSHPSTPANTRLRLRVPELLDARGITPAALASASDGRISRATAFRLVQNRGHLQSYKASALEALCDVLGVTPGELLELAE